MGFVCVCVCVCVCVFCGTVPCVDLGGVFDVELFQTRSFSVGRDIEIGYQEMGDREGKKNKEKKRKNTSGAEIYPEN